MSDYLKHIKNMIEKYAQDAPPDKDAPPTRRVPKTKPTAQPAATPAGPSQKGTGVPQRGAPQRGAPTKGQHPPAAQNVGVGGKSPAVEKMQTALVNLAKAVQAQVKAEDVAKITVEKDEKGQDKAVVSPEASEAAGRASFSDSSAQVARDATTPGVEYDTSKDKIKKEEKQPSETTRMYSVMNTMSRPGSPASEIVPDGKWGFRTNAALHNAYAFAYAMLKLSGEFQLPIKSYTDSDLSSFVLPKEDTELTSQQKHEQAPALTKHVEAIHRMFEEVRRGILENPEHQSYIENNQPFETYKKVTPATQDEIAWQKSWARSRTPENYFNINLDQPGVEGAKLNGKVNLTDLVSTQSFNAWWNGPEGKELQQPGVTMPMVLSAIRKAIESNAVSAPTERPV